MNQRIYIDESKARNYLMAAAVLMPRDDKVNRQAINKLLLPGQRRIHMKQERTSRRRLILSTLVDAGIIATIYDAGSGPRTQIIRRKACIEAIVADASRLHNVHLVFEQDDTLMRSDRECLIECVRASNNPAITYEHRKPSQEVLLGIPDALAWAWAKGGDWRRRIEPIVTTVKKV